MPEEERLSEYIFEYLLRIDRLRLALIEIVRCDPEDELRAKVAIKIAKEALERDHKGIGWLP